MYGELPEIETVDGGKVRAFPCLITHPEKQCLLRLPTSAELMDYLGSQRSLMRDLGRGKSKYEEVPNPRADRKLFDALRLDKNGEEFDDAEALYAIGLITRIRVADCTRDGQQYIVSLYTLFGPTIHTVNGPWRKDMVEYSRTVDDPVTLPHGVEQHRFPPEVPCKLYDKILVSVTGYTDTGNGSVLTNVVPPHHKRAVVNAVMEALSLLDPSLDPNS